MTIALSVTIPHVLFPNSEESKHARLRSRQPSHGGRAALVRGLRAWRALCAAEPHPDRRHIRRLPDRERRHSPRALRCRVLPRPWHAEPARARLSDADPYRARRRIVSVSGRGIAGRLSRAVQPFSKTRIRRRHHLSRTRSHRAVARSHHRRGDLAQHGVQPAPRARSGGNAKIPDPAAEGWRWTLSALA